MGVLDDLMVVQEHDTAADQLRHRRDNLPELAELARVDDALSALERRISEVGTARDEIARRQRRHEDELASVEDKIAQVDRTLYSGSVTIPRELQALQAEAESLRRLRGSAEDQVLEAMTEREPHDDELQKLAAERERLDAEGSRLRAAVAEAQAAIEKDLGSQLEARAEAATGLPAELASTYEKLRAKLGGTGAARLVNGRCSGCHLTLPAVELDRIRREPPDSVATCDQCGRLLVR